MGFPFTSAIDLRGVMVDVGVVVCQASLPSLRARCLTDSSPCGSNLIREQR